MAKVSFQTLTLGSYDLLQLNTRYQTPGARHPIKLLGHKNLEEQYSLKICRKLIQIKVYNSLINS